MRLEITFGCNKGSIVDFNYNYNLSKLILESLVGSRGTLRYKGKPFKHYTYSQLYFTDYQIIDGKIVNLGEDIHWYVSSPSHFFIDGLVKGLTRTSYFNIGSAELEFKKARLLEDPEFTDEMEFTCMSPITISTMGRGGNRDFYCRIEEKAFVENIRYDLVQKYYHLYNSFPKNEKLDIVFDENYMGKKQRTSRLIDYNGIKILGYMVPFVTKGSPDLIRIGYSTGFGDRTNTGFGMVKIWHRE
ncbi:CRISPR-associated endoribonuclease Cas6 [Alkalicella caledoniensis]|uniref:CRISPR-associated endoribonuclease n=1 Tax=Alkalicella caledoniensis TaxID=2731377 RepID=A0A7G9W771_ALKCA|nr:CRISPR-associated endoribonuclease Cas6 [Alkalicella caledoniensis]QNO14533.1 CRISPR-associated endoribonuclease Cas6 [Alkalicella caledoniensis]